MWYMITDVCKKDDQNDRGIEWDKFMYEMRFNGGDFLLALSECFC